MDALYKSSPLPSGSVLILQCVEGTYAVLEVEEKPEAILREVSFWNSMNSGVAAYVNACAGANVAPCITNL